LQIAHNGQGTVTPALVEGAVVVGGKYTLTATPASGWVFGGWTAKGLQNINSNSQVLSFTLSTNTFITANFQRPTFYEVQGGYNGLFSQSNAVDPASSGAFTLTLNLSGTFSGRLLIGSKSFSFNSRFSPGGQAQFTAKNGEQSLTVNLQLDMTGQSQQMTGNVTDATFDASLTAYFAPAWTARNPAPFAGTYTMSLPWDTGTLTNVAGGDSYGTATVSAEGVLTVVGALADGSAFSASAPVATNGAWPFYTYAAAGKDTVLGWVNVAPAGLSGTNITWSKAAVASPLYKAGFTNTMQLIGSPWTKPAPGSTALNLSYSAVFVVGGDSSQSYASTNLSLSVQPSTGLFSGWFEEPNGRRESMGGVVLQDESRARGFFLGTNYSGAVLLESQ
jgi:hypothetical protein